MTKDDLFIAGVDNNKYCDDNDMDQHGVVQGTPGLTNLNIYNQPVRF